MTRKSAYNLRERAGAGSFAVAWDRARGMGQSGQLDRAIERSIAGEVRPVFYRGRKCGEHVRYNDGLTIAVLKLMERQRAGGQRWPRVERDPWDY
ncbi:MAG TPA: hypothetical protein VMS43_12565 [Allosphingosinicella sp.]|nr:hypothetical protein [Allosphingosinicella sp.]